MNIGSIMMQMRDYKKARQYYYDAIINIRKHIYGEDFLESILDTDSNGMPLQNANSLSQQHDQADLAINKFILACRRF